MEKFHVGTSGYSYKDWKGTFYPENLPAGKWFEFYEKRFSTVELNVTFYRLPKRIAFVHWYKRSPEDFLFFVKGSRYITHLKRLKDPKPSLKKFFSVVSPLKEKLAGVLWQFPSNFKEDAPRLEAFLEALAKYKVKRSVFEFRNETWLGDATQKLLKAYGAAYCHADWPPFYLTDPPPVVVPFVYVRRHGVKGTKKYRSFYSDAVLKKDAQKIRRWLGEGREVFAYFNNDYEGHAIQNADTLARFVGKTG